MNKALFNNNISIILLLNISFFLNIKLFNKIKKNIVKEGLAKKLLGNGTDETRTRNFRRDRAVL